MAIKKCSECGGNIASSAKVCPHCGAKNKRPVGLLGWIFVLLVVAPIAWQIGKSIEQDDAGTVIFDVNNRAQQALGQPAGPTREDCKSISEYAEAVLGMRHMGAMTSDVPVVTNPVLLKIADDAFDTPRIYDRHQAEAAAREYGRKIYRACMYGEL